jgi:hypothetical protein
VVLAGPLEQGLYVVARIGIDGMPMLPGTCCVPLVSANGVD